MAINWKAFYANGGYSNENSDPLSYDDGEEDDENERCVRRDYNRRTKQEQRGSLLTLCLARRRKTIVKSVRTSTLTNDRFSLSFSFSLYYLHAVGKGFINHIFRPYTCLYFA